MQKSNRIPALLDESFMTSKERRETWNKMKASSSISVNGIVIKQDESRCLENA